MNRNLTAKQRAFIDWYVILLNGTESARRAGYKGNDVTLAAVAYENLRKPHLRSEIERRLSELTMTADELLKRITDTARGDLTDYIDRFGGVDIEKMKADGKGHLLKKYKRIKKSIPRKDQDDIEVETIEIELYAADAAHDKLMRYYGKYNDRVIHEWREEAEKAGIPANLADEIFERDVEQMLSIMTGKDDNSD